MNVPCEAENLSFIPWELPFLDVPYMCLFLSIVLGTWWVYSIWKHVFFHSGNFSWFSILYFLLFLFTTGIFFFKMLALLVPGSPFFSSFFSFPNYHLWNFAFHSAIASQISPLKFLLNFFTYTIMFWFPTLKKKICSYFKDTKPPIFEDINHVY